MKNQNIIDCYKLDLVKDIPEELKLTKSHRNDLFLKNQRLKSIIWTLGISLGCLLAYNLLKNHGKKQKEHQGKSISRENETEY
ncbi:hypothetical protein [Aquimarina latercula]|uniref:hypothetical protein n=1 Tax=Aquimarina latercula TaxID=987 RepID=UPI0004819B03|nr:hypothetical protein [Aquimarina latercula]